MAHVMKFTHKAIPNILRHNERSIINSSNPDIDCSYSHLNYQLSPERGMSAYSYYQDRKSELHVYNRADVKTMAGWIVTAPKDLSPEQHEGFFAETYKFLEHRYGGEKNVVQAIVHLDESQPHLHFCFIPAAPDLKHGGEKVCANDVLNRRELRDFHPALQKHLTDAGINVRVLNGATANGNMTVRELKAQRESKHQYDYERGVNF